MSDWMLRLQQPPLPATEPLSPRLDRTYTVALAAFGFFLPFSVAGTSVLLGVLLLLALASLPTVWRARPWQEPTWALGLALLAYIAAHTLLVDGWSAATRSTVVHYKELLLAPIVFAMMRLCSRRQAFLHGLVAGAALYALAHWVALFHPRLATALNPRYISAGFIFAVLTYQLLLVSVGARHPMRWRAAAAFFAATVLFALQGRTGQVVLLVLLVIAAQAQAPKRWRVAALLAVVLVAVGAAAISPPVQKRVSESWQAFTHPQQIPASSTEIRIELVRHGLTLAREHLMVGGGYSHYSELHVDAVRRAYGADPQRRGLADVYWARTDNPHDEFVMQVVGGGIVALLLFLAWLLAPVLRRQSDGSRSLARIGLVAAFATGCLFNSLLLDFVEGHFYMAMLAYLLAQEAPRRQA